MENLKHLAAEPLKHLSTLPVPLVCGAALSLGVILYFTFYVIYNVYFHPLRHLPGPLVARATRLPMVVNKFRGNATWHSKLHEKYGDVVRLAPNEVSFINPQAWKDIYGFHGGSKDNFPKDYTFYGPDAAGRGGGIFRANDEAHARQRRIFSHAFSDRALNQQEPILKSYVDKLITRLSQFAKGEPGVKLDIEMWYNFTTFDVMADLTFGEPLELLDNPSKSYFVHNVMDFLKVQSATQLGRYYPLIPPILDYLFIPRTIKNNQKKHFKESVSKVNRRLDRKTERGDIWSLVIRQNGDKGITLGEMQATGVSFMTAGTETTATALSGLTYYLLTNPEKLKKLTTEIRTAFPTEGDMNILALARLPYLQACFDEALRMYPPVPGGPPRVTPASGGLVCGEQLPPGTTCYFSSFAAYRSPRRFKDPDSFVPERWMGDERYVSDNRECVQPFSFGPRNCLGKNLALHEMRSILGRVLWNFDMELCEESQRWPDQKVFVVWSKPPLMVHLRLRADHPQIEA
ncbi:Isotrichodermin C-15 hydroxylase [Cladophialophora carrionii]|uniref:Isotrichodermin C-15 hydroxylase n=1 Tax=Cladophialophora carrionii TaxID=86049 RepID=A0A1C1CLU2_9EURO|nr:Isotrichodermin C-15 hydroxylase [Cladophialophora carrionii]